MAGVVLNKTETFNDTINFEISDMGQAVDMSKDIEKFVKEEEALAVPTTINIFHDQTEDLPTSSTENLLIARTPQQRLSANRYNNDADEQSAHYVEDIGIRKNSSHGESEQEPKTQPHFLDEEPLCAGETKDKDAILKIDQTLNGVQEKNTEVVNKSRADVQNSMSWSEKKKQFSMMKQKSEDSLSSEMSSQSRHSVADYLSARECDAEDVLSKLGFGFDPSINIPDRFWHSSTKTIIVVSQNAMELEDDVFDCTVSSLASYDSSWSDSSMGRLPGRFIPSLNRISPLSSLSETNDIEDHSVIPSIIEPENTDHQEGTFDLMRHLRLNRNQHMDKGFLEPVKEEQEVSSVGSGSARTQVNAQQDSFDSAGNTSVNTKISRKWESEDSTSRTIRSNSNPENMNSFEVCENKEKLMMNMKDVSIDSNENLSKDEQSVFRNSLTLPQAKHLRNMGLPQDSFELEEIVTSEENLDRIGERRPAAETNRTSQLRRENSDESSGFAEDDSGYSLKRRSLENTSLSSNYLKEESPEHSNVTKNTKEKLNKDPMDYLLVPCQNSTPKTKAESRRSAFAKRHTFSTTRQKRVVFEDEKHKRSWSFEDFSTASRHPELDVKSRSLDEGNFAAFDKAPKKAATDSSSRKDKVLGDADSAPVSDTRERSFSESKAINNIKLFVSSLLSVRRKFKNPITSLKPIVLPNTSQDKTEQSNTLVVCTTLEQEPRSTPSLTVSIPDTSLTTSQKSSRHALEAFEENLQKYRTTFLAMDVISTSQDKFYTRKLQARFAWDILFIRRLRSQIKEELDVMQSNLLSMAELHNASLPHGVQHQMESLLRLQAGLREYLSTLGNNSLNLSVRSNPAFDFSKSVKDVENKIRDSVVQELGSMFQLEISDLRAEMKGKDDVIHYLLKQVEQLEESKYQIPD